VGKLREMNRAYAYALFLLCAATAIVSPAQISPLAIGGSGTTNYIPIWTNSTTLGNSLLYQTGGNVGIGNTSPAGRLDVSGPAIIRGNLFVFNGNLNLQGTTGAAAGVINLGGIPFIHECCYVSRLGYSNTFVGLGAGNFTSTGGKNTASGYQALFSNTTGYSNTASGYWALASNTTGFGNTASGYQSLIKNTTGADNTANGYISLLLNTKGTGNTASGWGALEENTTGSYNTAVGLEAGVNSTFTLPTTGSFSTFVGASATATVDGLTNATAIGYNAQVAKSNALVLGRTGTRVGISTSAPSNIFTIGQGAGPAIADAWDTYSSRRWKSDIQPLQGALGKVELLRGVSYTYTANGKRDIGMIAEEVGRVVPEVVSYEDNGKDARGIDYARLTALLVEAVKQQQAQIRHQQAQINRLKSEVRALEGTK
jgi:hypothetical protein